MLLDARCAGVLFTENPVTHAREFVIEASYGLGEAVVGGLVTPDQYRVGADGRVAEVLVGEKDVMIGLDPGGGTCEEPVPEELVNVRCLDNVALKRLVELAMHCQSVFGARLDIEWAFTRGRQLMLLQARAITTGGR